MRRYLARCLRRWADRLHKPSVTVADIRISMGSYTTSSTTSIDWNWVRRLEPRSPLARRLHRQRWGSPPFDIDTERRRLADLGDRIARLRDCETLRRAAA